MKQKIPWFIRIYIIEIKSPYSVALQKLCFREFFFLSGHPFEIVCFTKNICENMEEKVKKKFWNLGLHI